MIKNKNDKKIESYYKKIRNLIIKSCGKCLKKDPPYYLRKTDCFDCHFWKKIIHFCKKVKIYENRK